MAAVDESQQQEQQQGQIIKSMAAGASFPPGEDLYLGSDLSEAGSECPELDMEMDSESSQSPNTSEPALSTSDDIARNTLALAAAKALLSQFIVEQEYHGHDHTATPALTPNGSSWIINGLAFSRLGLQPGKLLLNVRAEPLS
jgi:hypothetical protein